MIWLNRHLVNVLFGLTLLVLLGSAWLHPDVRPVAYVVAWIIVIAAIILRAYRRPRPPKAPSKTQPDSVDNAREPSGR